MQSCTPFLLHLYFPLFLSQYRNAHASHLLSSHTSVSINYKHKASYFAQSTTQHHQRSNSLISVIVVRVSFDTKGENEHEYSYRLAAYRCRTKQIEYSMSKNANELCPYSALMLLLPSSNCQLLEQLFRKIALFCKKKSRSHIDRPISRTLQKY